MADPKAILAIGGPPLIGDDEEEEDMPESKPGKGMEQMKLAAANRALKAFKSGDVSALSEALSDHYDACSSGIKEEF